MKRLSIAAFAALFLSTVFAFAGVDSEYWNDFNIRKSLADDLTLKLQYNFRFNESHTNNHYNHFDLGLDWEVNDWFVFGTAFRHVSTKKNGDWKRESRPHLNGTFKWKWGKLSFSDRNRFEFRIQEKENSLRYRNQLKVKGPKYTKYKIQPYVAVEPFYDFDKNDLNKNRFYGGVDFVPCKHIKLGVYYILEQRKSSGHWNEVNIVGTAVTYSF